MVLENPILWWVIDLKLSDPLQHDLSLEVSVQTADMRGLVMNTQKFQIYKG